MKHMADSRIAYVNGAFVPVAEARVSIFDRGFLFGDAIYEVTAVLDGKLIDSALHTARLQRSTNEIGIRMSVSPDQIGEIQKALVERNALVEGLIYLQMTRGVEERDFLFSDDLDPTLVMFTQSKKLIDSPALKAGLAVKSVEDMRWARRDIKSTCLLPQILAKRIAKDAGCQEAWMIEDGVVTEGASSTAYIVMADGSIVTRANSNKTLPGCTRLALLQLAQETGVCVEERPFSLEEALGATEAGMTSASNFVLPVTMIDGQPVGNGTPGPVMQRLRELYIEHARKTAI
ncbi:D-amino-acid transaminase [Phyllobacterium myrsinacearum]|uniref:Probable branched-chain-amino-acid aminotransferase n=1 Tax=Phyllobacterium myrsinacearum TaxID=28101 RepID=A0A839EFX7_9HYPH|nr:D-amino-acid transaminase [Phyllobacterium myrsinacearum]MBA8878871.1 D-alanine transaminase [Phyllobacterium myrsinacearum]